MSSSIQFSEAPEEFVKNVYGILEQNDINTVVFNIDFLTYGENTVYYDNGKK